MAGNLKFSPACQARRFTPVLRWSLALWSYKAGKDGKTAMQKRSAGVKGPSWLKAYLRYHRVSRRGDGCEVSRGCKAKKNVVQSAWTIVIIETRDTSGFG